MMAFRRRLLTGSNFTIVSALVLWLAANALSPAGAQDFLKQLEEKLRQAQKGLVKPAPQEGAKQKAGVQEGEAKEDTQESSPGEDKEKEEELPLPSTSPEASPPMQLPDVRTKRQPPIVITPRKKPIPNLSEFNPMSADRSPESAEASGSSDGVYLGLTLEPAAGGGFGLAVVEVATQSPAWKSGFREGDRLIAIGGQAVSNIDQFAGELQRYRPGTPVKFLVLRRGRNVTLTTVLQNRGIAEQIQGASDPTAASPREPYQPISEALMSEGGMVLGVSVSDLSEPFRRQFGIPAYRGAAISEVIVGSAAEQAGLRPGDCIVEIDGRMIAFAEDVLDATRSARPSQTMVIGFYRGRQKLVTQIRPLRPNSEDLIPGVDEGDSTTSDSVYELEAEIQRLQKELARMQSRVQELEARLARERR